MWLVWESAQWQVSKKSCSPRQGNMLVVDDHTGVSLKLGIYSLTEIFPLNAKSRDLP